MNVYQFSKSVHINEYLNCIITGLGKAMSVFPIAPRYAKMITLSIQHSLLPYTIAIVAALTVQEIFIENNDISENKQRKIISKAKQMWIRSQGNSLLLGDIMVLLNAVGASEYSGLSLKFCQTNGLRYNAINEIHKLRLQLTFQVNEIINKNDSQLSLDMDPPNDVQANLLRQIVLCGFFDHVARKIPDNEISDENKKNYKNAYKSIEVDEPVFLSSNSILTDHFPEFVVYQEVFESSKLFMRNVTAIQPDWLPIYVPNLCTFSSPMEDPPPRYDAQSDSIKCHRLCTFGPHSWPIPPVEVEYPSGVQKYQLFAKFLLEGEIIPYFKKYSKQLVSPPGIITKSWASLQPRTELLLKPLMSFNINTRTQLIQKWKKDAAFLLSEYLAWTPSQYHTSIKSNWPPINEEN